MNRSDAALVRVISSISTSEPNAAEATRRAADFVQAMWSSLERHLPS